MDNLLIDRASGFYRFTHKGKALAFPSATAVLERFFPPHYTEEARRRGTYVHAATALLDGGGDGSGLAWERVPTQVKGYLEAWERFKKDSRFLVVGPAWIERPVFSLKYRFAGTPDRLAWLHKPPYVVDLKTGSKEDWHALQTAAYGQAVREQPGGYRMWSPRRLSVYLRESGDYTTEEWTDPGDLAAFLGFLTGANWLHNRGQPYGAKEVPDVRATA